jgi:MoaA/NifB/PqqE/SkfB family radical SAM enzyme
MSLNSRERNNRNRLKDSKPAVYEKIQRFDEKIRRGETIAIIQMQYNYQCNLACEHCCAKRLQGISSRRGMTVEDVRILARQADDMGLARFVITGGEPLTFKELDAIVAAIDPQKFFINMDSNGWFLDAAKARHLKALGIDRVQLSLDSFDEEGHDAFRRRKGSYKRTMAAVDACQREDLDLFIQTVVTKERLYSQEFIDFVEYFNGRGIGVFVSFAKPVGAWERHYEGCIDENNSDVQGGDLHFFRGLERKYRLFSHLTPAYGLDMGCIAVKGMFSVTQFGDVLPCPYMHVSIGNIFAEPLRDIVRRGLSYRYFGERMDTCIIAQDRRFFREILENRVYDKNLPVFCTDVFSDADKTITPFHTVL